MERWETEGEFEIITVRTKKRTTLAIAAIAAALIILASTRFLSLNEQTIDPELPRTRIAELMKGQNPDNVPIFFGAHLVTPAPIGEVTITYKYKGLTKKKTIVLKDVATWR